jgi:hypothetical protein
VADSDRPSKSGNFPRISSRATTVDGAAPRASGAQDAQRVSRSSKVTGSGPVLARPSGSGPVRNTASGPQATLASTKRWKKPLKIGAAVVVPIGLVTFILWSVWGDSSDERALPLAASAGAKPAARATAQPAPPQPTPPIASPPPAPIPIGAATAAPIPLGAGESHAPAEAAGAVAHPQARDASPPAETRRAAPAIASTKAASGGSRPGSADAGVAAAAHRAAAAPAPTATHSPDGGQPPPARAAAPRRERAEQFQPDDDGGGRVKVATFSNTGGSILEGRIVDIDTGRPLAGATVEARYGESFVEGESDASGFFKMPGMVPGSKVVVWVGGRRSRWVAERFDVSIPDNGKPADLGQIRLLDGDELASRLDGWIGMYVARRGGQVKVTAVNAWVPANKAGIEAGDTVLSVDGRDVRGLGSRTVGFLLRGPSGSSVTLEVESGDGKRRKLTLTRVLR